MQYFYNLQFTAKYISFRHFIVLRINIQLKRKFCLNFDSTVGNKTQTKNNGKVTVKDKRVNSGGGYGLEILYKYAFEGDSFSITWLKNKLAKEKSQVQLDWSRFETNDIFCIQWFCTTVHWGHLERINHNERLIINISFVISVVTMVAS